MAATTLRASYTFSAPVLQRFNALVPHGERSRVMEELMKFTLLTRDVSDYLTDRYSERKEKAAQQISQVANSALEVNSGKNI